MMPAKIAIYICDADVIIVSETSSKYVDHDRCNDCLAGSRNTWAEEDLLVRLEPLLEIWRV